MPEHGDLWTLEDGKKYVVVSVVTLEKKKYVYLMDSKDYKKFMIAEYTSDDGLEEVDDPNTLETLIVKFNEDLKENLPKIIEQNL